MDITEVTARAVLHVIVNHLLYPVTGEVLHQHRRILMETKPGRRPPNKIVNFLIPPTTAHQPMNPVGSRLREVTNRQITELTRREPGRERGVRA